VRAQKVGWLQNNGRDDTSSQAFCVAGKHSISGRNAKLCRNGENQNGGILHSSAYCRKVLALQQGSHTCVQQSTLALPAGSTTTPDSNGIPLVKQGSCGGATASQGAMKQNVSLSRQSTIWHTTRPVLP